jgi:hypothetical protein
MKVIRYSKSFKLQVVREVEAGEHCAFEAQRKYNIKGIVRWFRRATAPSHKIGLARRARRLVSARALVRMRNRR